MWIKTYVLLSILGFVMQATNLFAVSLQTVILNVTLNGQNKGDFFINLTDDQDILMTRGDLKALGIENPPGDWIREEGELYLSLRALEGLSFFVNSEELTLDITADPSLLPMQVIDFDTTRRVRPRYTSETSAYLNYRIDYGTTNLPGTDTITLTQQLGTHHRAWSFLNDGVYTRNSESEEWTRLMTHFTHDLVDTQNRLDLGDFFARSSEITSSLNMAGLSYSKNYSLNPFFIRTPQIDFSGAAAMQTELQVLLDGVPIRKTTLEPGEFRLENISSRSGSGLLEVVLKDPFGKEERIAYPFYISEFLLKEGLHDYSYNLGFLRENFAERNADYGPLAFSGFHRYGLSDSLNIEASLDWMRTQGVFSTSSTHLLQNFGSLTFLLAASRNEEGEVGDALRVRYSFLGNIFNGRFDVTWQHPDFASIQTAINSDKKEYEAGAGIGFGTRDLGHINLDYRRTENYNGTNAWSAQTSYSRTLSPRTSLFISLNHFKKEIHETTLFFGIQYYPGQDTTLSVQAQQNDDSDNETVHMNKNAPLGEGFGGRGQFERSASNGKTLQAYDTQLQYNFRYAVFGGQYRHTEFIDIEEYSIAGALSFVGDTFSFSRPITDSFGLVEVGNLEGVRVTHNGQEMGTTDGSGKLLIPNLVSYYDNQIAIDDRDIPINFTLGRVGETVSPYFSSGTVIPFKINVFQALGGVLLQKSEEERKPFVLALVVFKRGEEEVETQTGLAGEFYIENLSPGFYSVSIETEGEPCRFDLEVPATNEIFSDLGELVCEAGN